MTGAIEPSGPSTLAFRRLPSKFGGLEVASPFEISGLRTIFRARFLLSHGEGVRAYSMRRAASFLSALGILLAGVASAQTTTTWNGSSGQEVTVSIDSNFTVTITGNGFTPGTIFFPSETIHLSNGNRVAALGAVTTVAANGSFHITWLASDNGLSSSLAGNQYFVGFPTCSSAQATSGSPCAVDNGDMVAVFGGLGPLTIPSGGESGGGTGGTSGTGGTGGTGGSGGSGSTHAAPTLPAWATILLSMILATFVVRRASATRRRIPVRTSRPSDDNERTDRRTRRVTLLRRGLSGLCVVPQTDPARASRGLFGQPQTIRRRMLRSLQRRVRGGQLHRRGEPADGCERGARGRI